MLQAIDRSLPVTLIRFSERSQAQGRNLADVIAQNQGKICEVLCKGLQLPVTEEEAALISPARKLEVSLRLTGPLDVCLAYWRAQYLYSNDASALVPM